MTLCTRTVTPDMYSKHLGLVKSINITINRSTDIREINNVFMCPISSSANAHLFHIKLNRPVCLDLHTCSESTLCLVSDSLPSGRHAVAMFTEKKITVVLTKLQRPKLINTCRHVDLHVRVFRELRGQS